MRKDTTIRRYHDNLHKWLIFKTECAGWALCTPKYMNNMVGPGSMITYYPTWEEAAEALWN